MRLKLSEKEYESLLKKKRIKINGSLKSSLRKESSDISYKNFIKTDYMLYSDQMFFEYVKMKNTKKYQPKVLISQILLNLSLITIIIYFFEQEIFFKMFFIFMIIFLNWFIVWSYSLISIIKNDFKKKSHKSLWLLLIFFIPVSAFLYPDFKRIQIE